jgi:hypothetical protein
VSAWELTADELTHVRRALYVLRGRIGPWSLVAKALHMGEPDLRAIRDGEKTPSAPVVGKVAAVAGVASVDLLAGRLASCPRCGYHFELPGLPE